MAWASAEIPAAELAYRAADKPYIVGRNWLRDGIDDAQWNKIGDIATGDDSEAGFEPVYGYDDHDHDLTKADDSDTTWYYVIDYGSEGMEIDCVAILNPSNLNGVTVSIEIDDDGTFASAQEIASTAVADDNRVIFLDLQHTGSNPRRYTSVRAIRIKFVKGAGFIPGFGELIIGRGRQLHTKPLGSYDDKGSLTNAATFTSQSGIMTRYVYAKKQRTVKAAFRPHTTAEFDDLTTFHDTETDGGSKPYLWVDEPTTAPENAIWVMPKDPGLSLPVVDYVERVITFDAVEQGPNFLRLEG